MLRILIFITATAILSACSNGPDPEQKQSPAVVQPEKKKVRQQERQNEAPKTVVQAQNNVLYYYQNLETSFTADYPLTPKGEQWVSYSSAEYEIDVVVDTKNGYIEIEDEGTGGGLLRLQFVMFRLDGGQPMIAINETFFDGLGIQSRYAFLHPENDLKYDWTAETIDLPTPLDFMTKEGGNYDLNLLKEAIPVYFELPRYGTDLVVKADVSKKQLYCGENANEEWVALCPAFNQLYRDSLVLKWNKLEARFQSY